MSTRQNKSARPGSNASLAFQNQKEKPATSNSNTTSSASVSPSSSNSNATNNATTPSNSVPSTPNRSSTSQKSANFKKAPTPTTYPPATGNLRNQKDSIDSLDSIHLLIVDEAFINDLLQLDQQLSSKLASSSHSSLANPITEVLNSLPTPPSVSSPQLAPHPQSPSSTSSSFSFQSQPQQQHSSSHSASKKNHAFTSGPSSPVLLDSSPPTIQVPTSTTTTTTTTKSFIGLSPIPVSAASSAIDPTHLEILSRWKAKLGLLNVKSDLREVHLISFYHSTVIWMKEKSFSTDRICAALSICKILLDKILSLSLDESIDPVVTTLLNVNLEKYNKLFSKEQQQDFTRFLHETLFRSYRLYRLAFNVDLKNFLQTPFKKENEKLMKLIPLEDPVSIFISSEAEISGESALH